MRVPLLFIRPQMDQVFHINITGIPRERKARKTKKVEPPRIVALQTLEVALQTQNVALQTQKLPLKNDFRS